MKNSLHEWNEVFSMALTCRVGVWLECARHHFSQAGGGIPTGFTAAVTNGK